MSCSGCSNAVNRALSRLEGKNQKDRKDINIDRVSIYSSRENRKRKVAEL